MELCKLCLEEAATKTNSHIFPHSLIKESVNLHGSRNRDKEFVFNFSSTSSPTRYQGQSIIPEAIDNLELPIDNIEQEDHNTTTEDYIFCPDCEGRFSAIEGYFAEKVITPFLRSDIFENGDRTTLSVKNTDNRLLRLYIYGLFWRASISQLHDFKLSVAQEEKLRILIHCTMDLQISVALSKAKALTAFCSLPMAVFVMEKFDDTTRSFIDANVFCKIPYMNLVGDFIFFLYFNEKEARRVLNNFYGLTKYLRLPGMINCHEEQFVFGKIFKSEREEVLRNAMNFMIGENIRNACGLFSRAHRDLLKRYPRNEDLVKFRNAFVAKGTNISDAMKIELIINNLASIVKRLSPM
jgi:hypothetical protein